MFFKLKKNKQKITMEVPLRLLYHSQFLRIKVYKNAKDQVLASDYSYFMGCL